MFSGLGFIGGDFGTLSLHWLDALTMWVAIFRYCPFVVPMGRATVLTSLTGALSDIHDVSLWYVCFLIKSARHMGAPADHHLGHQYRSPKARGWRLISINDLNASAYGRELSAA